MSLNKDGTYTGYIYKIESLINGKCYIGQTTTTIAHRWGQHSSNHKNMDNMIICKAIRKYGKESFKITQLEEITKDSKELLIEELNKLEILYIKNENTLQPNGYNISVGGNNISNRLKKPVDVYSMDGIFIESLPSCTEVSEKYSISISDVSSICSGETLKSKSCDYIFRYKDEPYDKFDPYHYKRSTYVCRYTLDGKLDKKYPNFSMASIDCTGNTSARCIIRNAVNGINRTACGYLWSESDHEIFSLDNYRKRIEVDQYDINGNYITTYPSLSEATVTIGKDDSFVSGISQCCRKERTQAYGYIWRYKGDPLLYDDTNVRLRNIKVDQYSIDGTFIKTHISIQDALRDIGVKENQVSNIKKCCDGISPIRFGYVWRYTGDPFSLYPVYIKKGGSSKPVSQYTLDGSFIKSYPSAKEAATAVGIKKSSQITYVCKGYGKTAKGYIWKYSN